MASLGRRGGLRGGVARARALTRGQRSAIASRAAQARWSKRLLGLDRRPRDQEELLAFVAHYGARVSKGSARCSLEGVALRAVRASRRDPGMARMLPVFLWRVRKELDLDELAKKARELALGSSLGYFLELTGKLGSWRGFDRAIARLRPLAKPDRAVLFFHVAKRNPFEAMAAEERTPIEARRWGLLTGTPTDSFASYFRRVRDL
jgi:hypothetical protein